LKDERKRRRAAGVDEITRTAAFAGLLKSSSRVRSREAK
jgi:hypothetical protein